MARRLCGKDNYPAPLLAVAGFGLAGAQRPFPEEPLDNESWSILLAAARKHRLIGQVREAIDQGALPATEAQLKQAVAAHRSVMLRVLSLEQELIAVIDLLAGAGIDTRVLKGSAVAHLDYPQPALRSFIDLDVLVRPANIDEAIRLLGAAGFVRTLAEPRPGFDRRFDKGTTLLSPAGYELDLHRTFVLGPWGMLVDLDDLWNGAQEFILGGRAVHALTRPNRFLHACYHAALGDWPLRLGSLRDIAEMLRHQDASDQDGEDHIRLAADWGVAAIVAAAVADTHRLLGMDGDSEIALWANHYEPSRRERARLALHTQADKTFAAQALATVPVIPRLRDKVAYLFALILPGRQYTSGRHQSSLARFRFAVREVRRGRAVRR